MNDTDTQVAALRKLEKRHRQNKRTTLFMAIFVVLGWLLFLYKTAQTPEYVMRYSQEAQESMGQWVLYLTLLTLLTAGLAWWTARFARKVAAEQGALKTGLRDRLATADEGERGRIESQLRELGA